MRTPSTSDLVHRESCHSYDKLAVISDNIEALREIYNVIFDIQEWLRQKLKDYVSIDVDQSIDSVKSFNQEPRLIGAKYYSNLDALENIGRTYATYIDGNPALCFEVTRTEPSSNSNLTNDTVYTDKAYLIFNEDTKKFHLDIPPTIGTDDYSSVRVDYLNERLSELVTNTSQEIEAALDALEFDDTPTDGSTNPVTSTGIYHFVHDLLPEYGEVADGAADPCTGDTIYHYIENILGNLPSGGTAYTLPIASDTLLGGIKVGDYLVIDNSTGVLSVDYGALLEQLRLDIGLTEISDAPYGYVSTGFSQLHSSIAGIVNSGYSLMKGQAGTGNSYLNPIAYIGGVGANGELTGSTNTNNYGVRLYTSSMSSQEMNACRVLCKNTSTNISKTYLPIRTVIVYNGVRHSSGGTEAGGLYWQSVQVRVWYRDITYTLTAEDITAINDAADTFAESLSLGVDTGDIS